MSNLTIADVEKIALLARLALTEEEKVLYQHQLSAVLDYVEQINELDLAGVEPTTHAVARHNVWREDEVNSALTPAEALANTAAHAQNQFLIQRVHEVG